MAGPVPTTTIPNQALNNFKQAQSTTTTTAPPASSPPPPAQGATGFAQAQGQYGGGQTSAVVDPNDFEVKVKKRVKTIQGLSQYVEAEGTAKSSELMNEFYKLQGQQLRDLQERLFQGGFYGKLQRNQIPWGVQGDELTSEAFDVAVTRAGKIAAAEGSNSTTTVEDVIDRGSGETTEEDGAGQIKISNPDDIAAVVKKSAVEILGRGVDQETIDRMTQNYLALEKQQGESELSDAAVVVTAPDPSTYIADQLRAENPGEATATEYDTMYNVFSQMISNSSNNVIRRDISG